MKERYNGPPNPYNKKGLIVVLVFIGIVAIANIVHLYWYLYILDKNVPGEIQVVFEAGVDKENATLIIEENNCTIISMRERNITINDTLVKVVSSTIKVPEGHEKEYIKIFESYEEVRYAKRVANV